MNHIGWCLKQAKRNKNFNPLITQTYQLAEDQCREHLKNRRNNVFTVVVKDNFAVKDIPMTCASAMLANYTAPYTATVVERLLNHGGCLVGKANMDEFAMGSSNVDSHYGPTKNALNRRKDLYDDFYVAGGSSGGCAVAVSLTIADVAIGSDTGGSTRNPASFNHIVGFKPSYGLVSRHGLVPLANSFDSPSFFTRTVKDCQRFFEYTLGRDPNDYTSLDAPPPTQDDNLSMEDLKRMKIAIPKEFFDADLSADCKAMWLDAIERLKATGVEFVTVSLPHTKHSVACYHILNESDVFSNMARYDSVRFGPKVPQTDAFAQQLIDSRTNALNHVVRRRIFAGNYFNLEENKGKYYQQAAKIRRLIQQDFDKIFKEQQFDAILVPSTNSSAPRISEVRAKSLEESRNDDFFTQSANMCGLPAISVPFDKCTANEMPIGMQLICPFMSDRKCLALGFWVNRLSPSFEILKATNQRQTRTKDYWK